MTDWLRFRRRPTPGEAEGGLSDARAVSDHSGREDEDPEARRRRKLRQRALVLGLFCVCLAGSVAAVVGEGGYLDMLRWQREIAELRAEVALREARVEAIREAVRGLEQDALTRERVAREQLGLVRPGEIDFLLPREPVQDDDSP